MRPSTLLLGLPALASAQQQIPLMETVNGYMDQAQEQFPFIKDLRSYASQAQAYLSSAAGIASNPAQAASAMAADKGVTRLTWGNWEEVLKHSGQTKQFNPPEAWMIYITANNASCFGRCDRADNAWNTSVPYFLADPSAPKLATLDCGTDELLCGAWAAEFPSIWFLLFPQPLPDQSAGPTDIYIYELNRTTVTDADITKIHTRKTYLSKPKYEGPLHPFDGWLATYQLQKPLAYFLFALSKVPSWAFMIFLSFFSRWFVNKRMPRPVVDPPAGAAPAQ